MIQSFFYTTLLHFIIMLLLRFSLQACLKKLLLVFLIIGFSFGNAHETQPAVVDFTFNKEGFYQLSIQHNLEAIISEIGSQHEDTDDSENTKKYNQLRELTHDKLNTEFEKYSDTFLSKMQLFFDDKEQALRILDVEIAEIGDIELARESIINIAGLIPENTQNMSWKWDKSLGNAVLRVSSEENPELYSVYLTEGNKSDQVPIGIDCSNPKTAQKVGGCAKQSSKWDVFKNYIQVGFDHIIPKGLDHILFVVGLFLLSTQLRPLLIQITSFTLAHTITLALGMLGIVTVSASIVEPLIAASIIYVCVENIYSNKLSRWRPIIIFLFGLLHGLGFASVLNDFGLSSGNFITGLIAFNIGVEFGQLAVIALCFIAVGFWFRNKSWYRQRITIPASIVIALIASFWFVQRIGLIN